MSESHQGELRAATSAWDEARAAETAVLSGVTVPFEVLDVAVSNGRVRTFRAVNGHPPIVLVHGVFGALGNYVPLINELSRHYSVFALDLLGWGLSSRPELNPPIDNGEEAQSVWVRSLEEWREALGLTGFVLVGHSLGGWVCGSYASKPENAPHIRRLILACAIGVCEVRERSNFCFFRTWVEGGWAGCDTPLKLGSGAPCDVCPKEL